MKHSPPGGALHRALDPEGAGWDVNSYLLALNADLLAAGNWQRAGDKKAKRPEAINRPGDKRRRRKHGTNLTQMALQAQNGAQGD